MPKRKLAPPDERSVVASTEEVRERLLQWIKSRFENFSAFEVESGLAHTTVTEWKRGGLPNLENLLRCRAMGLSLDWLATGEPQSLSRTPIGELVEQFRPYLLRDARVFPNTGLQAFHQLVVRITPARMVEIAASALQKDFDRAVQAIAALEEHQRLVVALDSLVYLAQQGASDRDDTRLTERLVLLRSTIEQHLPADFKRDSPKNREYWAAVALSREAFIAVANNVGQIETETARILAQVRTVFEAVLKASESESFAPDHSHPVAKPRNRPFKTDDKRKSLKNPLASRSRQGAGRNRPKK